MSPPVVQKGSRVTLHFTLSIASGLVIDGTHDDNTLTVVIGAGDIAEGLEKYLIGLAVGDRREFEIPAGEVYGPVDPGAIHTFQRDEFPPEMVIAPGQVIGFALPSGEEIPALVLAVDESGVQVDLSHPLAGHDLMFDVEILGLVPA